MKFPKNLLAATILAFAIATTTFAGDVGFPPAPGQPPPCTSATVTPDDGGSSDLLIEALLAIVSIFR
jgi:hypothetical protein